MYYWFDLISDVKEYCETEVFQPRCGNNEVIVMTRAHYGRMKVGGCVKKNLGYLGCTSDVLTLMDQRCSGRTSCQIRIPDTALDDSKPCLEELKTYLEAQYMCVRGMFRHIWKLSILVFGVRYIWRLSLQYVLEVIACVFYVCELKGKHIFVRMHMLARDF